MSNMDIGKSGANVLYYVLYGVLIVPFTALCQYEGVLCLLLGIGFHQIPLISPIRKVWTKRDPALGA